MSREGTRTSRNRERGALVLALASSVAFLLMVLLPVAAEADFGIQTGGFTAGSFQPGGNGVFGTGAAPDTRAGGHPFQATVSFALNEITSPVGAQLPDGGGAKDLVTKLPAGFLGDPYATPQCRQAVLVQTASCPNNTVIGIIHIRYQVAIAGEIGPGTPTSAFLPVYNMVPSRGEPALFAFYNEVPSIPLFIHLHLDPARDYAVTASVSNITGLGIILSSELTIWGVPAEPSHDAFRGQNRGLPVPSNGCLILTTGESSGSCPSDAQPAQPLLTDPTSCDGNPLTTTLSADSWADPGSYDVDGEPNLADPAWSNADAESPALTGCSALRFGGPEAPVSLSFRSAVQAADTPAGYTARLTLPYNENSAGLANPTLREVTVSLPEGLVVNPSSANGLGACSTSQIGLLSGVASTPIRFDARPPVCPDSSKLGTVEVTSPLVDHPLLGAVYLASQGINPFGSLLALYVVVEDPESGILVKLAGRVTPDPRTGQLTASFEENPQLPVTELDLSFFGGSRAALVNPTTCGTGTTSSTPHPLVGALLGPPSTPTDTFSITSGPNGAPCAFTEGQLPNRPSFEAGTVGAARRHLQPLRPPADPRRRLPADLLDRRHPARRACSASSPGSPTAPMPRSPRRGRAAGPAKARSSRPRQLPGGLRSRHGHGRRRRRALPVLRPAGTPTSPAPTRAPRSRSRSSPRRSPDPSTSAPWSSASRSTSNRKTAQIHAVSDPIPTILDGIPLDIRSVALEPRPAGLHPQPDQLRSDGRRRDGRHSTLGQTASSRTASRSAAARPRRSSRGSRCGSSARRPSATATRAFRRC